MRAQRVDARKICRSHLSSMLRGSGVADHLVRGAGFVNAERLFRQKIAAGGEGARAATHAHVTELATAALSFEVVIVAKRSKYGGIVPNLGKALLAQIAGKRRQITAREDFAFMRDETHTGAGQAALGHGIHVARMTARMASVSDRRSTAGFQRDSR